MRSGLTSSRTVSGLSQRMPMKRDTPSIASRATAGTISSPRNIRRRYFWRMALLVAFAVVAGAGTAVTPCVLPVLPALLSASATGGRRRPLGIILGLTVTFVVAIVGLASVIDGVGLADGLVRTLAVIVLVAFGVALAWPRLGELVERPLTRLAKLGPGGPGDGFRSGLLVGA